MAGDDDTDPDRAAILARRRRFIALAISGLATAGCKRTSPEPCLSIEVMPEPNGGDDEQPEAPMTGPFVEDPGAPLETGETGGSETGGTETSGALEQTPPEVCLKVAAPPANPPTAKPRPCLKKRPSPQPCLMIL